MGITVRTKWQSSPTTGDSVEADIKGNRQNGDILVSAWENLLDLSRNIYPYSDHQLTIEAGLEDEEYMKFSFIHSIKWSTMIAVITLVLAAIFSIISSLVLSGVTIAIGVLVVLTLILIGIVFDTLGLAAAAADEVPFHAMASEKVFGARQAIQICRNADRFSSFCNDVIGDISGIVSGTASAIVVLKLVYELEHTEDSMLHFILAVIITSIVAALTVGGKALGKSFAIHHSTDIVLMVGKVFCYLEDKCNIKIFSNNNDKKKKNKQDKQKQ